jgi:uncharacterized protein YjdB
MDKSASQTLGATYAGPRLHSACPQSSTPAESKAAARQRVKEGCCEDFHGPESIEASLNHQHLAVVAKSRGHGRWLGFRNWGKTSWLTFGLSLGVLSCAVESPATPGGTDGLTAHVVVRPANATLHVGGSLQLVATPEDSAGDALSWPVTWSSSDTAVAPISAGGLVTGTSVGSVSITATSQGIRGNATVNVTPVPVTSVALAPSSASLFVGDTLRLTAIPEDSLGTALSRPVTWSSSDSAIATASETGLVTGLAVGFATITATSEGKSSHAHISVDAAPVASVQVNPTSASIQVGNTIQLTAVPEDANGNALDREISWISSDTGVATVSDSGLVTGVAAGSATITATSEERSGSSAVLVTSIAADSEPPQLVSISFSPDSVDVSASSATTRASLHMKDEGTGVSSFRVFLQGPTGTQPECSSGTLLSGTIQDGIWACSITIPQASPAGQYKFAQWDSFDRADNSSVVSGTAAAGYSDGVTVTGAGADSIPPQLVSISFSPDTVDASAGSATTHVTLHMTDQGTGVSSFRVFLQGPTGTEPECSSGTLMSGTIQDGTWVCDITIPQASPPGQYKFAQWDSFDAAGNSAVISGTAASAYSNGVTVH